MLNIVLLCEKSLNVVSKICRWYIKPTFQVGIPLLLFASSAIVQAEQSKFTPSAQELKEVSLAIEAAEKSIFNLKIQSEAWVETKTSLSHPNEPWQRTSIYWSSTAWFEGDPFDRDSTKGKARVDVHKRVLEWQEGAAPYAESSYSVGFDGQYGRVVHHTRGHSGKTFSLKVGKRLLDTPKFISGCDRFTGARFSLNFSCSGRGYTFSDLFQWADDPNTKVPSCFEFTGEVFQGVPCIKIASKGTKRFQKSWWLDPSRGFALLAHESTSILEDGSEQVISSMKVTKLRQVAPGIWWPMEAYVVSRPYAPGKPWRRFVYRASNVVANDPNFDENIFTVPFPDGYSIDDQVTGKKYIVGEE